MNEEEPHVKNKTGASHLLGSLPVNCGNQSTHHFHIISISNKKTTEALLGHVQRAVKTFIVHAL